MGLGQLPLHGLGVLAVLPGFGFDLPDVILDLVTVITPHHDDELTRRGLFKDAGQQGVGVWLHVS